MTLVGRTRRFPRRVADGARRRLARGATKVRGEAIRLGVIGRGRPPLHWHNAANFGDQLSPFIIEAICGSPPIWVPGDWPGKIVGLGSILHVVAPGDRVWGSGCIEDKPVQLPPGVRVLAVRGPLTRSRIQGDVPEIYGDPAMLLPRFFQPPGDAPHRKIGIVPHVVDRHLVSAALDPSIRIIDVRDPWPEVVDQICACDVIASSSLHGIIVAEAYGIPATWVEMGPRIIGGPFKYHDYLLATGRDRTDAVSWESGLEVALRQVLPPPQWNPAPLMAASRGLKSW